MHQPNSQTRLRPFKPTPFGRYTLLMPLAVGGMGEIFLARLEGVQGFEKLCVIKKVLPHLALEEDFIGRFVNEAKTLVQLQHGSIAQVLDMGLHDGSPFLALEFVDGKDLRKIAGRARERSLPLPLTFVLYTMGRVLDALAYAHRKRDDAENEIGLVHRDISPQNILVSYEGEVKVIDFGLVKSTLNVAKTNPSIVMGKFLYMSPEQARHAEVDRRTDLYSVGLCLYELVAGKNPFDDDHPGDLMARVASPTIPPIQTVEPLCPGSLAALVMKALAIDPAHRFQTAEEFRSKLAAILVDIDSSAGPETCSRFMRESFSAEYASERKLLSFLREQRVAVAVTPLAAEKELEPPSLGRKDSLPAMRSPIEPARHPVAAPPRLEPTPSPIDHLRTVRSIERLEGTPTPFARSLSEQPPLPGPPRGLPSPWASRLKDEARRAVDVDRVTLPSVVVTPDPAGEPITAQAALTLAEDSAVEPPETVADGKVFNSGLKHSLLWPASEPTVPAGPRVDSSHRSQPDALPAVMTLEPSEVIEPLGRPRPEGRLPTLTARAVMAPLPPALKNKAPPPERPEATGITATHKSGLVWMLIPLLAVLGVAGYVIYTTYNEQVEREREELHRDEGKLGRPTNADTRSREVAPLPATPELAEPPEITVDQSPVIEPAGPAEPPTAPLPEAEVEPLNKREPPAPPHPPAPKRRGHLR